MKAAYFSELKSKEINMNRLIFTVVLLLSLRFLAAGQGEIEIRNPSFEFDSYNQAGQTPMFWQNFGSAKESPPDLQPGFFGCQVEPFDGHSCLGLVTRDNGTTEAVGQKLSSPLKMGIGYTFRAAVAQSSNYFSLSRVTGNSVNYNNPVVLRILGYEKKGSDPVVLAESPEVFDEKWRVVNFNVRPQKFDCNWLVFQVYFLQKNKFRNGNLLLDNISNIKVWTVADSVAYRISMETAKNEEKTADSAAHEPIFLKNPSFESIDPSGSNFLDWAFLERNVPIPERCVDAKEAATGDNFLTLTTSRDGHFAKILTELPRPLLRGKVYRLSFQASHCAPKFKQLKIGGEAMELADHQGCFLRILGVDALSGEQEQLAVVNPVTSPDWTEIHVELAPKNILVNALIFQAWNDENKTGGITRHMFLDDFSPISLKN